MKKLSLYVETSVFGFYYDATARNRQKRIAVRTLLLQIKERRFQGYVSGLVRAELEKTPDPYRRRLLGLIDRYGLITVEYDEDEVARLQEKYLEARVVPGSVSDDAAHVAIATVSAMDVVVSCNLRHLANELAVRRFLAVNMRLGYRSNLSIRQPEEVVIYED